MTIRLLMLRAVITLILLFGGVVWGEEWTTVPSHSSRIKELEDAEKQLPELATQEQIQASLEAADVTMKMAQVILEGKCDLERCASLYTTGKKVVEAIIHHGKKICETADQLEAQYRKKKYQDVAAVLKHSIKERKKGTPPELSYAIEECDDFAQLSEDLIVLMRGIYGLILKSSARGSSKEIDLDTAKQRAIEITKSKSTHGGEIGKDEQQDWLTRHGF